jgi:large subunit ribosomal protein L35
MPKMKTHKGMKKRFKVTATGKFRHKKAFRGHKLSHKGAKRRRQLRADGVITGPVAKMIAAALSHGE